MGKIVCSKWNHMNESTINRRRPDKGKKKGKEDGVWRWPDFRHASRESGLEEKGWMPSKELLEGRSRGMCFPSPQSSCVWHFRRGQIHKEGREGNGETIFGIVANTGSSIFLLSNRDTSNGWDGQYSSPSYEWMNGQLNEMNEWREGNYYGEGGRPKGIVVK